MRILQLCNKPPFPPIDGGSKAMANIATGLLKAGHEVTVLCIATSKHPLLLKDIPKDLQERTNIQGVFVDTSLNVVDAFTDLITADNYNISRFFSPDMDILLIRTLSQQRFDIVHLESLFMTPYIPTIRRYTKAPIVLRSHNLEHVIQERIAQGERNFLKRPYRKFLAKQLHDHEMAALQRVDGVAAISPSDEAKFAAIGSGTPIVTIPFSVDPEEYRTEEKAFTTPSFFHLGSMDWLPNEEAIRWLLSSVWPRVIRSAPKPACTWRAGALKTGRFQGLPRPECQAICDKSARGSRCQQPPLIHWPGVLSRFADPVPRPAPRLVRRSVHRIRRRSIFPGLCRLLNGQPSRLRPRGRHPR